MTYENVYELIAPQVDYVLIKTESSFCPMCNDTVELLTSDGNEPMFYICFECREVRRVGVGLVKRPRPEEE